MKLFLWTFLTVCSLQCFALDLLSGRCGGDGPKPFKDITNGFLYQSRVMSAVGGVKEFTYWDEKDQIVYRNSRDEVRTMTTGSGFASHQHYTNSRSPLSQVVDPFERQILTENPPAYFDTKTFQWANYSSAPKAKPVFVDRDYIYSLTQLTDSKGTVIRTDVKRFNPQNKFSQTMCSIYPPSGGAYKLAYGSKFPYVYFWHDAKLEGRNDIIFSGLNVVTCVLDAHMRMEGIRYPVKDMYVFPSYNGKGTYLFRVDHPRENLLWWNDGGCQYYDVDNLKPVVLSYSEPTVATWSEATGLQVVFLQTETRAKIMGDLPIADISEGDLRMNKMGTKLFLAPLFRSERAKWLMQVRLDKPYGPIPTH